VHDAWDKSQAQLDEALLYNRKLWTIFLSTVTDKSNPLPVDIRQNVANIGIFVMNQHCRSAPGAAQFAHRDQPRTGRRPDGAGLRSNSLQS
jgi:flagellar biosynthesis regulator FlaF